MASAIVALHLVFVRHKAREIILILSVVLMGFCVETAMIQFHILVFSSPNPLLAGVAPFWVLGLYALLAMTVNYALCWLQPYRILAACLGASGGVFSYAAGQRMGAVEFILPEIETLLVVGTVWFFLMPAIYTLNRHLTKRRS